MNLKPVLALYHFCLQNWASWWFFSKYMLEVTTVDMQQLKELTV
jgi:hypothetical protein